MDWFRLYSKIKQDATVQELPLICFKAYINILCEANDAEDRGFIKDAKQIAFIMRLKPSKMEEVLLRLESEGLIMHLEDGRWTPTNWDRYQMASDNVAERVAKHRAKKQAPSVVLTLQSHKKISGIGTVAGTSRKINDDFSQEESKTFRNDTATVPIPLPDLISNSVECNVTVTPQIRLDKIRLEESSKQIHSSREYADLPAAASSGNPNYDSAHATLLREGFTPAQLAAAKSALAHRAHSIGSWLPILKLKLQDLGETPPPIPPTPDEIEVQKQAKREAKAAAAVTKIAEEERLDRECMERFEEMSRPKLTGTGGDTPVRINFLALH